MTTTLPMELVEKIMELNYHSIHSDQWRRITVKRMETGERVDAVKVCEDGLVSATYFNDHWLINGPAGFLIPKKLIIQK